MKYILNAILSLIALSSICVGIFKTTELSSKCTLFAIALSCIELFSHRRNTDISLLVLLFDFNGSILFTSLMIMFYRSRINSIIIKQENYG